MKMKIAPHPDDETLGCGERFKHKNEGDDIYWAIYGNVTEDGWSETKILNRKQEIKCFKKYSFSDVFIFNCRQQNLILYL